MEQISRLRGICRVEFHRLILSMWLSSTLGCKCNIKLMNISKFLFLPEIEFFTSPRYLPLTYSFCNTITSVVSSTFKQRNSVS